MRPAGILILLAWSALCQTAVEKQLAAVALQRETIRKQAESMKLVPLIAAQPDCAAIPEDVIAPLIEGAAKAQELQPKLLRAVIAQESGFKPCAVSRVGAQGLMQLMPATAQELGVDDSFDPRQNIEGGAKFLKQLIDKYKGDLPQALGAYNAGPGAVDDAGGIPNFPETQNFVKSILGKLGSTRADPLYIPMPKPIEN